MDQPFPMRRWLGQATAASLIAAAAAALSSVLGLAGSGSGRYSQSQSVLVSQGADAANLIAVLLVLVAMWLARRGSVTALLLWPGGLFYVVYASVPYLVGAAFTPLLFGNVAAVLAAVFALACLLTGIDGPVIRDRFADAPARAVGAVLTLVGVLAYGGLGATAAGAFANSVTEAAWRGHWFADWVLGTPVLIMGGILLWARCAFGYVTAPGLLLVSALGGVVLAAAAVIDNLSGGIRTDAAVIAVHLVISAGSAAVLVWFLRVPHRRGTEPRTGALPR